MISVRNLVKSFGDFTAVKDITFDVAQGEIFAFLGPNGAGKTTTIKMLTTLLRPTSGRIELDGLDPTVKQKQARQSFGMTEGMNHMGHLMGLLPVTIFERELEDPEQIST